MAKDFAKRFYDSKAWSEARAYALKRDRYLCQDCKSAPAEEVHHIEWLTPDNINDPRVSVNPDNLISLCYDCHKARHKGQTKHHARKPDAFAINKYEFDAAGRPIPPGGCPK